MHHNQGSTSRLEYIDGLKGISIILVMMNHWAVEFMHAQPSQWGSFRSFQVVIGGQFGVLLFFIISAFTLHRSTLRRFETETHPIKMFYLRRFLRIVPLWWIAQALYAAAKGGADPLEYWCCIFLVCPLRYSHDHLFMPGWSLFVEESFYLFLPALLIACLSLRSAIFFTIASYFLRLLWFESLDNFPRLDYWTSRELFPPAHWYCFGLGLILFWAFQRQRTVEFLQSKRMVLAEAVLFILFFLFFGKAQWRQGDEIQALLLSGLFIVSASPRTLTGKIARSRFLRVTGIACYSLYLFHPLLIQIFRGAFLPLLTRSMGFLPSGELVFLATFPWFLAAMLPLGWLSHKFLERPLLEQLQATRSPRKVHRPS
jgi:peptidoglycan/LPS O-acetylase OafA/YrhL